MAIADENQSIVETGPILRIEGKYAENLKIATLNINSLSAPGKFEGLQILLSQGIDILVVNETKLDESFPSEQFIVDGFKTPYRLDRNRTGGGIIIYVRHDIPSKALTKFKLPDCDKHGPLEWIFLELRLKESKWLFMGGYSPPSQNNAFFINSMTSALDFYSSYDNFSLPVILIQNLQKAQWKTSYLVTRRKIWFKVRHASKVKQTPVL